VALDLTPGDVVEISDESMMLSIGLSASRHHLQSPIPAFMRRQPRTRALLVALVEPVDDARGLWSIRNALVLLNGTLGWVKEGDIQRVREPNSREDVK
jgi:hypothetical protein